MYPWRNSERGCILMAGAKPNFRTQSLRRCSVRLYCLVKLHKPPGTGIFNKIMGCPNMSIQIFLMKVLNAFKGTCVDDKF